MPILAIHCAWAGANIVPIKIESSNEGFCIMVCPIKNKINHFSKKCNKQVDFSAFATRSSIDLTFVGLGAIFLLSPLQEGP
jgi:hypothetical protein